MIILSGDYTPLMEKAAKLTFKELNLTGKAIVDVIFADKETIKQTNRETRNVDSVTDVLSFPMIEELHPFTRSYYPFEYDAENKCVEIGSIMLCVDKAKEQAEEYGHSVEREMTYLFVHGLLHILGYDHMTDTDKALMREKEEAIMSKLRLTRE